MRITRAMLDAAAREGLVPDADALWRHLATHAEATPGFRPAHILYYLGGLVAIGAMTLFMTLGWEMFRGPGLALIAALYIAAALGITHALLRRGLALPAGLTAALAVCTVPLLVYGLQHALGAWADAPDAPGTYREYHTRIDWRWLVMELCTLAAGVLALWRYRLPFLVLPVAVTLWYLGMDLTDMLLGDDDALWFSDAAKWTSVGYGLAMLLLAFWVDLRSRFSQDYAFWLYVFGTLTFWGGLSSLDSDSALGKFAYLCINLALIAVGAALSRRVLAVFGALGVAGYLGYLSRQVFEDSLLFPLALTAIGLGVIGAGIAWQRHEARIAGFLRARLPREVRELVEARA